MHDARVFESVRVAICIPTYRRRELLTKLLVSLSDLKFKKVSAPFISVVVVDNDEEQTAQETCAQIILPWSLKYVVEPRRGIATVRNRAILEAGAHDFIVMVDDDEFVTPFWLDELLSTCATTNADVVAGPVLPEYSNDVPKWVLAGGFFDRPAFATGEPMEKCSSNNVLIKRSVFDRVASFSDMFELTGAEDTEFFLRTRRAGFNIVWCNEAVVYEDISSNRANADWLLRRAYRLGNSWSFCEKLIDTRPATRFLRFVKGLALIVKGLVTGIVSPIGGKASVIRSLQMIWYGAGQISGLWGHRYEEYRSAGVDSPKKISEFAPNA